MIEIDYVDYAYEAYMRLSYSEIDSIVSALHLLKREKLPEKIKNNLLPVMEDFLIDNY